MAKDYPDKEIKFIRSVAEWDLVALHTHQKWPDGEEYVIMDFFRFDKNGKIVEHWDSMQQISKESKNGNKMYWFQKWHKKSRFWIKNGFVTPTGVEPVLFALKGRCVNQLHQEAILKFIGVRDGTWTHGLLGHNQAL